MDFLVMIDNTFPPDSDPEKLANLVKAESQRAKELSDQGILKQLWRRPGKRSNVGIWSAEDATALHTALTSLPFFPWLEVEIIPLAQHPNDPAKK